MSERPRRAGSGATPVLRPDSLALMLFLAGVVAVGPLSTDMYLPSLPDMTRIFGAEVSRVQLTLSVFIALAALGAGAWLLVRILLRETLAQPDPHALDPRRLAANYAAILGDREFLGRALTGAFAFSGLFASSPARRSS